MQAPVGAVMQSAWLLFQGFWVAFGVMVSLVAMIGMVLWVYRVVKDVRNENLRTLRKLHRELEQKLKDLRP